MLALDGDLAKAEPKTLRRVLHAADRLVRSRRRRHLKVAANWPWAAAIVTAWNRISALPQPPDQHETVSAIKEGYPGPVETPATCPPTGPPSSPHPKIKIHYAAREPSQASDQSA